MPETQLTSRQIQMVVVVIVALMCGMMAYVFNILPSNTDLVGSRRVAIASGIIAGLAAVWFVKLLVDAAGDRSRGVERGPAKLGGRFNIFFGAAVAIGGATCSALTYWSATTAGGGIWTLYYGMILWGLIQMCVGYRKTRPSRARAAG